MTWYYNSAPVTVLPDDCVGFVYCITNMTNNRKYIGKKLAKFSKTTYKVVKLKNGSKRRKKISSKIDSDWATYFGSSAELQQDIAALGEHCFHREILYYCKTKSECSYVEAREQFSRRVLESTDYYNGNIQVRIHKNHILNKI